MARRTPGAPVMRSRRPRAKSASAHQGASHRWNCGLNTGLKATNAVTGRSSSTAIVGSESESRVSAAAGPVDDLERAAHPAIPRQASVVTSQMMRAGATTRAVTGPVTSIHARHHLPRGGHTGVVTEPDHGRPERPGLESATRVEPEEVPPRHHPRERDERQRADRGARDQPPQIARAAPPGERGHDRDIQRREEFGAHRGGNRHPRKKRPAAGQQDDRRERHRRGNDVVPLLDDARQGRRRERVEQERQQIDGPVAPAASLPDERRFHGGIETPDQEAEAHAESLELWGEHGRDDKPRQRIRRVLEEHGRVDASAIEHGPG